MSLEMIEPLIEMKNISKSFGRVQALKNVSFILREGEILGIVGDNGAGKSSLIKILAGVHPADEGEMYFKGKNTMFSSPLESRKLGIEVSYQHLALIEMLSISRNFFIGKEPKRKIGPFNLLDERKMNETCIDALKSLEIKVRDVLEPVSFLSGGERQSIAIARSLYFGTTLLILDEPTAALSIKEANKVFNLLHTIKNKGLSIIFITHNIEHVFSVADTIMILEKGIKIGCFDKREVTKEEISEMIVTGRALHKKTEG